MGTGAAGTGEGLGRGLPDPKAGECQQTTLSLQAPSSHHQHRGMGLGAVEVHHGGPGTVPQPRIRAHSPRI